MSRNTFGCPIKDIELVIKVAVWLNFPPLEPRQRWIGNECRVFTMASRNAFDTLFLVCYVVSVTAAMPQARMVEMYRASLKGSGQVW